MPQLEHASANSTLSEFVHVDLGATRLPDSQLRKQQSSYLHLAVEYIQRIFRIGERLLESLPARLTWIRLITAQLQLRLHPHHGTRQHFDGRLIHLTLSSDPSPNAEGARWLPPARYE